MKAGAGVRDRVARRKRQGLKKRLDDERSLWGGVWEKWEPKGVVEEWGLGRGLGSGEGVEPWD